MKSSYDADLAAAADVVWAALTDLDTVIPALPGAVLERDGDALVGSVKTRLGAIQVTYRVTARADIGVSGRHVAVVVVTGREARGTGTLAASLTVTVRPGDAGVAHVEVNADIDATGRGESADSATWSAVIAALLAGVLPFPVIAPVSPAPTTSPPPASSAPAGAPARTMDRRMIFAGLGMIVAVLVWRRKRRK